LLQQAVITEPVTYDDVVRKRPTPGTAKEYTGWASSGDGLTGAKQIAHKYIQS
jgi:hypothetical protein